MPASGKSKKMKVAMLTAGGLAPCLSAAVGGLILEYSKKAPKAEIIGYKNGYMGLLKGSYITVTPKVRKHAGTLLEHGGSPLGNSRVKLTNVKDCIKRGLIKEGQDPLQVAAEQLVKDGITILHTIGGDDTNTTAADLAAYLAKNNYDLTVVGLPKTIDNDVVPIRQTLGAVTAAEQGAIFWENAVNEQSTSPRMLLIHEVMGRNCGWLTAATAETYRKRLKKLRFLSEFGLPMGYKDIDAVYVPEVAIDLEAEAARLKTVMDAEDCVTIFLSEGAGVDDIVAEMRARGEEPERDAFGHVKIDKINPGQWFAKRFADMVKAEKVLVQKSGYFARSAKANKDDLALIKLMVKEAVKSGLKGESGVIGHDEGKGGKLRAIEFPRIKGGKPFDTGQKWFHNLLKTIGQPLGKTASVKHGDHD
ncbi:MAG: pyrophosphate--fructose-6-phosphate 1-phosphotransferase [Proteobacteria bacterium]|nr:pyrophosphate--fructose-6-phosphate 1-phosphotransferase [Pseudomonadota bacterium]